MTHTAQTDRALTHTAKAAPLKFTRCQRCREFHPDWRMFKAHPAEAGQTPTVLCPECSRPYWQD